ncbi:MAG: HAMP domain-containing sensor histidine kinase [Pseudomonadota bacterium]
MPMTDASEPVKSTAGQTSQDMEDFIYLISHDVRASVRALLELPQWIQEDLETSGVKINAQVAGSIEMMNRHTGRLDRMLVDLLAHSRVGRMQTKKQLNLALVLEEVLQDTAIPSGFRVEHDLVCDSVVMGESDLPILLRDLVSNAIKHHDKPGGRLLLQTRREGAMVRISASDDGPGIAPEFHDRVFAPMTTLRPRDEVEGSGMGLAKVSKIAAHYGGDVAIKPSPFGRGLRIDVRVASGRVS